MDGRRALLVWGGWEGHTPRQSVEFFAPFLEAHGFAITLRDSLDAYGDDGLMDGLALIVQCWTGGRLAGGQWRGLERAVRGGCGLAGWHGGLCDSFREHTGYQFMTGGQWVAHPGDCIDYDIRIAAPDDPVMAGLGDFRLTRTEQYYLHVDPGNQVLATTSFGSAHHPDVDGVVMPAAWKRRWGRGRVFYASWGHTVDDFAMPAARTIVERGLLWAAA